MIKKKSNLNVLEIQSNQKAYFNFFIEKKIEAGLILKGWEVKSLRLGIVNINTAYITIKNSEVFLCGSYFERLSTISKNILKKKNDRQCKLLLNKYEINFLKSKIYQKGYTIIPLSIFLKKSWFKLKIGLAIGKKNQDKRMDDKKKQWIRDKNRLIKNKNLN
ncbi:SsrA-binding protein [Buchnera aphidicola (Eriosoma grossulariae)]|uniref:SsrA-binding protein SmpB n=1 Tax=Buchnera aphidicola TaxID=9 RepID=UPI003464E4DB